MGRTVDGEAGVRRCAYEAIGSAAALGLRKQRKLNYIHVRRHESFEAYSENTTRVNPVRRAAFRADGAALRSNFMKHGRETDAGLELDNPIRVISLSKDNPIRVISLSKG